MTSGPKPLNLDQFWWSVFPERFMGYLLLPLELL